MSLTFKQTIFAGVLILVIWNFAAWLIDAFLKDPVFYLSCLWRSMIVLFIGVGLKWLGNNQKKLKGNELTIKNNKTELKNQTTDYELVIKNQKNKHLSELKSKEAEIESQIYALPLPFIPLPCTTIATKGNLLCIQCFLLDKKEVKFRKLKEQIYVCTGCQTKGEIPDWYNTYINRGGG